MGMIILLTACSAANPAPTDSALPAPASERITTAPAPTLPPSPTNPPEVSVQTNPVWQFNGVDGFMPSPPEAQTPECGDLGWTLPLADLSLVVGRLEPGQIRGGDYKAHGGFRMQTSEVTVVSAINGQITSVAAYLENASGSSENGEVQYLIEIQNPCGIQIRYDHLKALGETVQKVLEDNGVKTRQDSRTTFIQPPAPIQAGDVIATAVGFTETGANYTFDFGAYDLRERQPTKRPADELMKMGPSGILGLYGLCWYDLFGGQTAQELRAIPVGSAEKGSDYCN